MDCMNENRWFFGREHSFLSGLCQDRQGVLPPPGVLHSSQDVQVMLHYSSLQIVLTGCQYLNYTCT